MLSFNEIIKLYITEIIQFPAELLIIVEVYIYIYKIVIWSSKNSISCIEKFTQYNFSSIYLEGDRDLSDIDMGRKTTASNKDLIKKYLENIFKIM